MLRCRGRCFLGIMPVVTVKIHYKGSWAGFGCCFCCCGCCLWLAWRQYLLSFAWCFCVRFGGMCSGAITFQSWILMLHWCGSNGLRCLRGRGGYNAACRTMRWGSYNAAWGVAGRSGTGFGWRRCWGPRAWMVSGRWRWSFGCCILNLYRLRFVGSGWRGCSFCFLLVWLLFFDSMLCCRWADRWSCCRGSHVNWSQGMGWRWPSWQATPRISCAQIYTL